MAEGFRTYLVAFILAGLFLIAVINFSIQFGTDNKTNITLTDNPQINDAFGNITSDLTELSEKTQTQRNATEKDPTTIGAESLLLVSVWGTIKSFGSIVMGSANYLLTLPSLLGIPPIVLVTIISIITISIIFFGWRLIRVGE